MSGGYWFDVQRKRWVQASDKVLHYIEEHEHDAQLAGLSSQSDKQPACGEMTLQKQDPRTRKRPATITWSETHAGKSRMSSFAELTSTWHQARAIVTSNGDIAKCGDHVVLESKAVRTSLL